MTQTPSVVLASAGSGKTYELAGRYIGALDDSQAAPGRILATTFTRKAAGEMLAKVLARLLEAARNTPGHKSDLGIDPQRASQLALALARHIDRVRVQTLDSYFAEVGRFGTDELGLAPGWRILDETEIEEAQEQAMDRLCRTLEANTFLHILEALNRGALPLQPRAELLRRAIDLHHAFVDAGADIRPWGVIEPSQSALLGADEVRSLIAQLRSLPPVQKNGGGVNSKFASGRETATRLSETGAWDEFCAHTLVQAALSGRPYCGVPVPEALSGALSRLARHGEAQAVSDLATASRAAGGLVSGFDRALERVKQDMNAIMFDDLPRQILSLSDAEREWISFRMDGKVDHLLLDEFQDTSRVQFRVLEPLLREITGGGGGSRELSRTLFAVGDLKQSLYSWRGAVPELLEGLSERLLLGAPQSRAKSWRSSQAVLDAVNRVFGSLPTNTALSDFAKAAERWRKGFETHSAARDLDGFACIEQVRLATEDEDRVDLVIDRAVERVRNICAEKPEWSVAVLTRNNDVIPRVIHRLRKFDILAAQERGHPLLDEACIGAVVSLLQLAEHPGDSASQFHAAKSALAPLVGLNSALDKSVGARVASDVRARIGRDGIAGLVGWLRSQLKDVLSRRASARMEHLERLASDFDTRPGGRIPEFIRLVHDTAVIDPSAGRVSVLTVHKAKGLEWDAVVIIDLERNWKGNPPAVVVDRGEAGETDPLAPVEAVSLWPNDKLQACDPRLQALAQRWYARRVREAMSSLYVAMTRARHRLEMILANEKEPRIPLCSAKVLRAAVASPSLGAEAGELFHWRHVAKAAKKLPPPSAPATQTQIVTLALAPDPAESQPGRAPSTKAAALDVRAILREPSANTEARRKGDLWHAWLESVEWAEDWTSTDEVLFATAASLGWPEERARTQIGALRSVIAGPIGEALSRKRYAGRAAELRVANEWPLAWMDTGPNTGLVKGRVDRVVIGTQSGKPEWAEILDYKTDGISADRLATSVDAYRAQIDAYRRAVAKALRLPLEKVEGTLLFVGPGIVAPVSHGTWKAESR